MREGGVQGVRQGLVAVSRAEERTHSRKLADAQDAAATADGGGAQRKRRRVAFEESAAGGDDGGAGVGAGAGAGAARRQRGAGAGGRRRSEGGGDGVDYFDDDEDGAGGGAGEEVVEEEAGEGFDVDDDEEGGDEREDAGGGADFGARVGKGAGAGGNDDDGDGDGKGGRVVKKLKRVRGEQGGRLEEEFNEAGQAFEPFNLRAEREDGYFDEAGNYHWKKKAADDYDPWLQELDAMDPKARRALQERAAEVAGDDDAGGEGDEDGEGGSKGGDDDDLPPEAPAEDLPPAARVAHLTRLWEAVHEGETVSDALRRLGAASRAAAKAAGASKKGGPSTAEQASFDGFVEAADALLTNGLVDVYTARRRDLLLELNDARDDAGLPPVREPAAAGAAAGAGGSSSAAAAAAAAPLPQQPAALDAVTKRWAYKWSLDEGAQVHGPFTSAEMAAWAGAGYFAGRQLYVQDTLAAPAAAPAPAAATPAAAPADDDDDDDDIFGGVGKYVAPPAAAGAAPAWVPLESVRF